MKIKFPTGTTQENNQLLLPEGMLSIDIEKKAIRLHDGVTQGGFEMAGIQAYVLPFRGEVAASDFITGDALAAEIGLSAGVAQYSDAGWLKFVDPVDQKTKYIAKRPFRHTVTWDQINAVNAVDGTQLIAINGDQYRVRLLRGANSDPTTAPSPSYDHEGTWGSEWNRLFYPLIPNPTNAPSKPSGEGIVYGAWGDYTETDLGIITGNGNWTWCQESDGSTSRVGRGASRAGGATFLGLTTSSYASFSYSWRPVLELI